MKVAITGASGLLGRALVAYLKRRDHEVTKLVRRREAAGDGTLYWNPAEGRIDAAGLEGHDAVVHLAGENIGAGRWTRRRRERIRSSRTLGTRLLAETLAGLHARPRVLVSASAVGFYGDRGEETLTEDSPPGEGFLAEVCREWEAATRPAAEAGIRVVHLRSGVVLSSRGGALAKMLPPFKLGLGGRVGDGRQFMPWIGLEDELAVIHHVMTTESLAGPVNAVAPAPLTNEQFTRALGAVLGRPTIFPLPRAVVNAVFGQMGRETLLASQRVEPARLRASGFEFQYPDIQGALKKALE